MTIPFTSQLSVPADVMIRQVGDEAVLLNLKTEQYLGLDDVSNRFWQVLTAGGTIQAAYDTLLAEFDVDSERLRSDLEEFVQELIQLGLVQPGAE
jgi:Coenzyme PQQ synthesis protein D (PqqD)